MKRRDVLAVLGSAAALAPLRGWSQADAAMDATARCFGSITELRAALAAGALTSAQLVADYLERIARLDHSGPEYRSVLALNPAAVEAANALDAERRAGRLRGPLHGIPILLKDNIESADPLPTTAGSLALARSVRGVDAPLVARLRAAGAIILGKANLSEWANFRSTHSTSGWSAVGGQTRNAHDRLRNPSGSSSGSAVATALGFCAAAIGSETDGSILAPASLNGIVGLKPTVGFVSGRGIVPLSPRQDTAGPMGRSVADVALLASVMGERPLGFAQRGGDLEGFRIKGLRIGVMPASPGTHPDAVWQFASVRALLEAQGAVLVDLHPPAAFEQMGSAETTALLYEFKSAINAYLSGLDPQQVPSRTLAALIEFNVSHASQEMPQFGQELFEQAQACGGLQDRKYLAARATLHRCADVAGLAALLEGHRVEVLLSVGNGPAELIDPVWGDRPGDGGWPSMASAAAIAGYPSLSVPMGLVRGLPVGIVLVGRRFQDGLLLQVGHAFERLTAAQRKPHAEASHADGAG